jgi:hypothetical protein
MKLTGAAILVSRGIKVLQAAPAAYPYRSAARLEGCMSRKQLVAGLLLVAVVGANLAVWLWRPWDRPWNQSGGQVVAIEGSLPRQFRIREVLRGTGLRTGDILGLEPDRATTCTVVCVNQTDKHIDALEFTYSGPALEFRLPGFGPGYNLVTAMPQGVGLDRPNEGDGQLSGYRMPRVTVGLLPGERRACCQFFSDGQIDSVTAFAGEQSTRQTVATKLAPGGSVVLTFEPGGNVRVVRE